MVASLLKIVSTGVQDKRLQPPEEQPDLGAFLTVIVKAGRYGTAWARIDFDTKPDFGKSGVIRIPTQGELVGRIMLVTQMPDIKTIQDKAYRARKVPKLFSSYYDNVELVENFEYLPGYSTVYPKGASMSAIPDDSITVLRNLIKTTGLSDDDITELFTGIGEDSGFIYGSSVLYAYKKAYTLGPGNVGVGDIDIAFRSSTFLNIFAKFLYTALGPDCMITDINDILSFTDINGDSIKTNANYSEGANFGYIEADRPSYKLISSSAPGVNEMGSLNVEKYYQQSYSYIHDAHGNIKGTVYLNTSVVSIYLPGRTHIQLVLCNNGLIGSRTLTQYIQQTMDFTIISGTFDGTTLAEPYSDDIKTNIAVYTQDIPQLDGYRLDWMLYRLQKWISRGFTVYFERQGQIDDWNSIPINVPLWGATLQSSTVCPFNKISGSLALSLYSFTSPRITIADFSGVQFDDLLVDATYSLKFEIPENAPRTVFSAYLTEVGLNTQTINKLNTDTIVLAAQYGKFMSFTYNGIDWTDVQGPPNLKYGRISKIAYNESFWAVAGVWGSTDQGTIGTTDPSGVIIPPSFSGNCSGATWNGLSGSNSLYLAFGLWTNSDLSTGILSSSVDGLTWETAYKPRVNSIPLSLGSIYSILWNGTIWIMACNFGNYTLLRSTNAEDWTPCIIESLFGTFAPLSGFPKKIAWNSSINEGVYVAAGNWVFASNDYRRSFIRSTDGITWSFVDNPVYYNPGMGVYYEYDISEAYDIVWTGYIYIAVGRWSAIYYGVLGDISVSEDGINWLAPVYAETGATPNSYMPPVFGATSLATNDSYVIITGNWNNTSIVKSSNNSLGYSWENVIKPSRISTDIVNLNCIVNSDTLHVAGGTWKDSGNNLFGTMASSTDGINWSSATYPTYLVDSSIIEGYTNAIGWNELSGVNSIFVAVGSWNDAELNADFYRKSICTSTNGYIWVGENNPDGAIGTGYCVKYISNTWWIGGNWATGSISKSSGSGSNILWNNPAIHPGTAISGTCYGIATNGTLMVAVGQWQVPSEGSTITKTITYSTDYGATWAIPINPFKFDVDGGNQIGDADCVAKCVSFDNVYSFVIGGSWRSQVSGQTYSITVLPGLSLGINFTSISIPTKKNAPSNGPPPQITNSIAYNGKEYIATGQWEDGTICTSKLANDWTNLDNPNSLATNGSIGTGIIWNSYTNNWVASGIWSIQNANVVIFNNGISWSIPINPPNTETASGQAVVWNPNTAKWMMSGTFNLMTPANTIRTVTESSDGITWSVPVNYGNVTSPNIRAIIVKGVYNLLFGQWNLASKFISYSSDALDWSYPAHLPGVFSAAKIDIQYKNGLWYLYGQFLNSDTNTVGTILYSANLIDWSVASFPTEITLPETHYRLWPNCVNDMVWNGSLWIAIGLWDGIGLITDERGDMYSVDMPRAIFSRSLNGLTWELPSTPANLSFSADNIKPSGNTITWNGSIYVATGVFTSDGTQSFTSSTDGITWSNPRSPIGVTASSSIITAVAWNDSMWVAIGRWIDANENTVKTMAYSYDGITWNRIVSLESYAVPVAKTISWNGTMWIVGGYWKGSNDNFVGNIMTSFDGINWTIRTDPITDPPPPDPEADSDDEEYNTVTATATRRTLPYTRQQLFSSRITNQSANKLAPINTNSTGSVVTWESDPTYKSGTNYLTYLYNTGSLVNSPTFNFVATKRTQWLTFGTYYTLSPVKITLTMISPTLTLISPQRPKVVSDLVGPHFSWTNSLGHGLINNVTLRIGGTLVDTIPGQLMEILDEFQTPLERVNETSNLICRDIKGFNQSRFGTQTTAQTVTTPIPFWFSRGDPGCFLPIDALNIDEVRITVQFNPITSLYYSDSRATTPSGQIIQSATPGAGLWPLADSQFYYEDLSGTTLPGLEPLTAPGQKFLPFPKIKMPTTYTIPESYLMVEYIYLDKPEANRFRIADIQVPVVQHYSFDPVDNQNNPNVRIPLVVPNPTRDLFFYCNRYEAAGYNAPFLGTRDLSNNLMPQAPWWPDSSGLDDHYYETVRPAYSTRNSEPIRWLSLDYSETLNRYSTENVALFRSVLPSIEQRKAPFVNRYYYNFPLGIQNGFTPFSMPIGQANLDKVLRLNLTLGFHGKSGIMNDMYIDRYNTYVFAETYNIFRVYGGRGGMMFAY